MTRPKNRIWRVRVLRCLEVWEEILAPTKEEAEARVLTLQGVKELRGVTVLAEKVAGARPVGVEDEEAED